jgi:putative serine/threonine protein kinase
MAEPLRISVGQCTDERFRKILCYPNPQPAELAARLNELEHLGIEALELRGSTLLDGFPLLGKGTVGMILVGLMGNRRVAVKIRRTDARRGDMSHEARMLAEANGVGVGPQLIGTTSNIIVMQLINGSPLAKWISAKRRTKTLVRSVLERVLVQARRLDEIGLDHGELSRAPKNVMIGRSGKPWIVDFESASMQRKPKNVTSIVQYFLFGQISHRVQWFRGDRRSLLKALRAYKQDGSAQNWSVVSRALRLKS